MIVTLNMFLLQKLQTFNWQQFYNKAYSWLLTIGPRILVALVIFFIGMWFIRLFKKWLHHHMHRKEFDPSIQPFLASLFITALQILLIIVLMQIIGLQLTIFTALIGAVGVAAGLALSGTLQNFTSGILILLLKPFRVGDNIIAQGTEGTVMTIEIFYTIVKAYNNTTVIIPNSKLSNEVIINLSREGIRRLDIELKFGFGIPFEQVNSVISTAIKSEPNILQDPQPRTGVSTVEADGYKVMVNVWTHAHGYQDLKLKFQEQLIENIIKAGIKLPGT